MYYYPELSALYLLHIDLVGLAKWTTSARGGLRYWNDATGSMPHATYPSDIHILERCNDVFDIQLRKTVKFVIKISTPTVYSSRF